MSTDGFLDKSEFVAGMKGRKNKKGKEIGAKQMDKMFAAKDSNSDGKISLEEFKAKRKKK